MLKRSLVLGLVLITALAAAVGAGIAPGAGHASSASVARSGPDFRCVMDAFGHTADGRIKFRRTVNTRVEISKSTSGPVSWRPISWGLVSLNSWPGHEETQQIVAATDGKVRLVKTEWNKRGGLSVRVVKVVGRGFPRRLVAFDERSLYWVAPDGSLRRATWTGSRFVRPTTLPITISGATAMTSRMTDYGMRIYYTDRKGALHVVAVKGASSTDAVLRSSGYRGVTGLRAGTCMSPNYARVRSYVGLLSVNRTTGVGRFQRILRPGSADPITVTRSARVSPSDWTWRRLG